MMGKAISVLLTLTILAIWVVFASAIPKLIESQGAILGVAVFASLTCLVLAFIAFIWYAERELGD